MATSVRDSIAMALFMSCRFDIVSIAETPGRYFKNMGSIYEPYNTVKVIVEASDIVIFETTFYILQL